jgi:replicative DNA helicase
MVATNTNKFKNKERKKVMNAYTVTIYMPFPDGNKVKNTTKIIGFVTDENPNKNFIRPYIEQVLEQAFERELNELEHPTMNSGYRTLESLNREKDELKLEFEIAKEAMNRDLFEVRFYCKVNN